MACLAEGEMILSKLNKNPFSPWIYEVTKMWGNGETLVPKCTAFSLFLHSARQLCPPSSQHLGVYLIIITDTYPDLFTDVFAAPHLCRQIGYSWHGVGIEPLQLQTLQGAQKEVFKECQQLSASYMCEVKPWRLPWHSRQHLSTETQLFWSSIKIIWMRLGLQGIFCIMEPSLLVSVSHSVEKSMEHSAISLTKSHRSLRCTFRWH